MLNANFRKWLLSCVICLSFGAMLGLSACESGDTDGGPGNDDAGPGQPFAGKAGSLNIELSSQTVGVGDTASYHVELRDSAGAPIPFVRIFCETERGVAIIEPSAGGVAFESTDAHGNMSGSIGGVTPGSFLMECRAAQGFNLYDRETVKVTGSVPAGFEGFPGAAGGNLGGGVVIDTTPDVDDGVGLRISGVNFVDAGGSTSTGGPLDITQNPDCDTSPSTTTPEPFVYTRFEVTVANDSTEDVIVDSIRFQVRDSGAPGSTSVLSSVAEIPAGEAEEISGILTQLSGCAVNAGVSEVCFIGTGTLVEPGAHNGTITVRAHTAAGEELTLTRNFVLHYDYVNNCAS